MMEYRHVIHSVIHLCPKLKADAWLIWSDECLLIFCSVASFELDQYDNTPFYQQTGGKEVAPPGALIKCRRGSPPAQLISIVRHADPGG